MNRDEHRMLREMLGGYALGQLTGAEAVTVAAHLDGCAACRAELAEIAPLARPLRGVDPAHLVEAPVPPPWLGERIASAAREQRGPRRGAAPTGTRRGLLVGAAAVLVSVAGGAGLGYVAGTPPTVQREPVALRAVDTAVDASASVIPHTWGVEITLVAAGFDAGADYRVVVIDDAGRQVDAGRFIGTGDAQMRCNLNSSVLRAQATGFDVLDTSGAVVLHGDL